MNNMDNIKRSLEEDILQDVVNRDTPLVVSGIDDYNDISVQNSRITDFNQRIKGLSALLYLKESTILDVKRDDAVKGSIYFNRETNCIEYFDGQSWNSNIFGPNNILDSNSFSIADLGGQTDNGVTQATITKIKVNIPLGKDKFIFIFVDGDLLDKSRYYFDSNYEEYVMFSIPVTVYNNISYYILGSLENISGSIPRYEVVSFICDGSRTVFPISSNENFITTYRSSIQVYINGLSLPEEDYILNNGRNKIILNKAPELNSKIEIKTLYGVTTDFRGNVSYVEQIVKASVKGQKVFTYNGVSDAIKVYLDGSRLILNEHFKFNYVQKNVILNDNIASKVEVGSLLIIEKEMSPMSKEPMYGLATTEIGQLANGSYLLSRDCSGVISVTLMDDINGTNSSVLLQKDWFLNDNYLNITKSGADNKFVEVCYLTHTNVLKTNITEINDLSSLSNTETWSINKIISELNKKLNVSGDMHQDVSTRNLHSFGDLSVDGDLFANNSLKTFGIVSGKDILIGTELNPIISIDKNSNSLNLNKEVNIKQNTHIFGDLTVDGRYVGNQLQVSSVENNSLMLNSNLTNTNPPVSKSSILVNRGKNGTAELSFIESKQSWAVAKSSSETPKEISLEGHTHNVLELVGDNVPKSNAIFSYKDTSSQFYESPAIENYLKSLCTNEQNSKKSISVLKVEKSSIVSNEQSGDIESGTLLTYDIHKASLSGNSTNYERINSMSLIEDGSPVFGSKGSLAVPSGSTNDRWESSANWNTKLPYLANNAWRTKNGLIRYNTTDNCIEMKIDGVWVQFRKPDMPASVTECSYERGRFIKEFSLSDWQALQSNDINQDMTSLGFATGEHVLKITHNLNSTYVNVNVFDDKRTSFPILYKCVDKNNVYLTLPSNIQDLTNKTTFEEQWKAIQDGLHKNNTQEGPGHNNLVNTSKSLDISKKYVAFITAL